MGGARVKIFKHKALYAWKKLAKGTKKEEHWKKKISKIGADFSWKWSWRSYFEAVWCLLLKGIKVKVLVKSCISDMDNIGMRESR